MLRLSLAALLLVPLSLRAADPEPKELVTNALKAQGLKDDGKAMIWKDTGVGGPEAIREAVR